MTEKIDLIGDYKEYAEKNAFMAYNRIEIVSADENCAVVRVELRPESMNLHGAVHGGLLYGMADCVAGVVARANGEDYVTQSAHINFLRNVTQGTVYARADVVRRGRRIVVTHVSVTDGGGRLLADCAVDLIAM